MNWLCANLALSLSSMILRSIIVVGRTEDIKGGRFGCTEPESVSPTLLVGASIMRNRLQTLIGA